MRPKTCPALALPLLVALAASVDAQTDTFDLSDARTIDWSPSGTVTRSAWGELTGDARMDAVFLDGDDAYLVYAPENHNAVVLANSSSTPANDVAVLPSTTPGAAGDLIVAGASGLFRLEFSYGSTPGFAATGIGNHYDWLDARRIEVADVNRDGDPDLIGLSSTGGKALLSYGPAFSSTTGMTLPYRADEICAVSWTDIGSGDKLEIAVLSPEHGIYVYALDGSSNAALSLSTLESGALAPLRDGGAVATHLAVLAVHDTADEELITWRPSSTETLTLGTSGAYAMVADDVDDDGDDDGAIAHTGDQYLHLFENLTGVSGYDTFDDGFDEEIDLGHSYADMWPVLGDLQGSGLADLLTFSSYDDQLAFYDNTNPDVNLAVPEVVFGGYNIYTFGANTYGELRFDFDSMPSTPTPSTITHMLVTPWIQDEWGHGSLPTTPPPIETQSSYYDLFEYSTLQSSGSGHVYPEGAGEYTDKVYHYELRFAEVDTSGKVVWVGPASTYVFTSHEEMADVVRSTYSSTWTDFEIYYASKTAENEPWLWQGGDGRPEGDTGSTRTPDIPDPDGDDVPEPDPDQGSGGSGPGGNG